MGQVDRLTRTRRPVWQAGTGAAAVLAVALCCGSATGSLLLGALYLLPALLIAVALWLGWYPGERALKRLRGARAPRAPRAPRIGAPRRSHGRVLRGGRLIAVSLAGRAPPPAAVPC